MEGKQDQQADEGIKTKLVIERDCLTKVPFKAFRQGDLDGLCGLYAIVSSVKYLKGVNNARHHTKLITKILHHLESKEMTPMLIRYTQGTTLNEIASVLKHIISPDYGIKRAKPYHRNPKISIEQFIHGWQLFLNQNCHGKHKAIILLGVDMHWTLLYCITDTRLMLHDSSHNKYYSRQHCCLPDAKIKTTHILYPAHTYFLSVD